MTKKNSVPLSFYKFYDLVIEHEYYVICLYCLNDNCKFIELKTPKYRKTFFLNIPDRYKVTIPSDIPNTIRKLYIKELPKMHITQQIQFLIDIKSSNIDFDLLSVNGKIINILKSDLSKSSFLIENNELNKVSKDDDDILFNEKEDENINIDNFISKTEKVLKKLDPTINIDDDDDEHEKEQISYQEDTTIILDFQDDEGNPIDDIAHIIDVDTKKNKQKQKTKRQFTW